MAPFKLDVATPFSTFPASSSVHIPAATLGPTPITVPVSLNDQFPAARASEHDDPSSACTVAFVFIIVGLLETNAAATSTRTPKIPATRIRIMLHPPRMFFQSDG